MDLTALHDLFEENKDMNQAEFTGICHDCGEAVSVLVNPGPEGFEITGGAMYSTDAGTFLKCDPCYQGSKKLYNYRPVEVFSRVVGYMRPIASCHKAKRKEIADRKMFDLNKIT